ncbi:hypothetical protein GCM10007989_07500 [Devosia pacifica]|uniref:Uncharacterized protein n=1 Tax=Devosia pacifica TaxID=1335967 RepID=A0A918RWJ5_9HYPH|nr:hypothetical protein [Devosia pacifica]GHA15241.1 hypothetical protein GCM10007989_07500 [Devosia pacifica]
MSKRGRPRKANAKRTPSGQISRAASAYAENEDPIRIRMQHLGLTEKEARDQKAASVHGIMKLRKKIDDQQYDAGEAALVVRDAYLRAIRAPDSLAATSGSSSTDLDDETYAERCNRARSKYADMQRAIHDAQAVHRHTNLWAALDLMLYRNEYYEHMEGDFSTVLRVLSVHFGLTKNRKSGPLAHELILS